MKKILLCPIIGASLTLMILSGQGCPSGGDNGGDGADAIVDMQNIAFSPSSVNIQVGQTVRWINRDFVPHTVTSGSPGDEDAGELFDSGTILAGGSFDWTFNEAGTFVYYCVYHPTQMRDATVIVKSP